MKVCVSSSERAEIGRGRRQAGGHVGHLAAGDRVRAIVVDERLHILAEGDPHGQRPAALTAGGQEGDRQREGERDGQRRARRRTPRPERMMRILK